MKKISPILLIVFVVSSLIPVFTLSAQDEDSADVVITRAAAPDPAKVRIEEISSGYQYPLYVIHAGDGSGRLFVMEQTGRIWIIQDGQRLETPFADFSDIVNQSVLGGFSERGLLGLAFHPDFAENGTFFINYTDRTGGLSITSRYRVSADDPNLADMDSGEILLTIEDQFPNHNGGHLAFGPDGYLYFSMGDGGGGGDPLKAGQDLGTLLGKLIRIDVDNTEGDKPYAIPADNPFVDNPDALPEIWAYGLRNAWRFSFDRATGDAYIADVGQNVWEEINFQPAGEGGANYGWSVYEGSQPYTGGASLEGTVFPIAEYAHREGDCSVTGGYVYRGEAVPELAGVYLFGDYCTGRLWATYRDEDGNWQTNIFKQGSDPVGSVSSFGEDEAGELYIVDYYTGRILRFVQAE